MNNKKIALTFALVVALMAFPAPAAAENAEEDRLTVILTPNGFEVVPRSVEPAGGANQVECGGTAPDETHCTTLVHVATEVWAVALGASFTYTGTLEVRLFHATSVLVFQVHLFEGNFAGAELYGTFPITPVFWHECASYEFGTGGDNPIPLPYEANGSPGGSGVWDCFVLYP